MNSCALSSVCDLCALFRAVAVAWAVAPDIDIIPQNFKPEKMRYFCRLARPVWGCAFRHCYYTTPERPPKNRDFLAHRGAKNRWKALIFTVCLWVVFWYTDCKKIGPKYPKNPHSKPQNSPISKPPAKPTALPNSPPFPTPIEKPKAKPSTITVFRNTQPPKYFGFPK